VIDDEVENALKQPKCENVKMSRSENGIDDELENSLKQ
jgi:hypothetical protein